MEERDRRVSMLLLDKRSSVWHLEHGVVNAGIGACFDLAGPLLMCLDTGRKSGNADRLSRNMYCKLVVESQSRVSQMEMNCG